MQEGDIMTAYWAYALGAFSEQLIVSSHKYYKYCSSGWMFYMLNTDGRIIILIANMALYGYENLLVQIIIIVL